MGCDLTPNVKIRSNIQPIEKEETCLGYVPYDLWHKTFKVIDARVVHFLPSGRQYQYYKSQLHAKEQRVVTSRYSEQPENIQECEGCPFRKICY